MKGPELLYVVDNEPENVSAISTARSLFLSNRDACLATLSKNQLSDRRKTLLRSLDLDTVPQLTSVLHSSIPAASGFVVPQTWFDAHRDQSAVLFLDYALHGSNCTPEDKSVCRDILKAFNAGQRRIVAFASQHNAGTADAQDAIGSHLINCETNLKALPNLAFCKGLSYWLENNPEIDPDVAAEKLIVVLTQADNGHPTTRQAAERWVNAAPELLKPLLDLDDEDLEASVKALFYNGNRTTDNFCLAMLTRIVAQTGWSVADKTGISAICLAVHPGAAMLANILHFLAALDKKSVSVSLRAIQGAVHFCVTFGSQHDYERFKNGLVTKDSSSGSIGAFRRLLGLCLTPSGSLTHGPAIYQKWASLAPIVDGNRSHTQIWRQQLTYEWTNELTVLVRIGTKVDSQPNIAPTGSDL